MPNFDGKGPRKEGSMTGRRMGSCAKVDGESKSIDGIADSAIGKGRGGMARGGRRMRCRSSGNDSGESKS